MPTRSLLKYFFLLVFVGFASLTSGQKIHESLPYKEVTLDNLDAFQPSKKSAWKLAGNVAVNRRISGNLESKEGNGILVYTFDKKSKPLVTVQEFGDVDIQFDFLLSKGSSFTVLMQNEYKIEITDSWMKPGYSAMKAPGLWQHLAIQFKAPVFDASGKKTSDARFEAILLNGQQFLTKENEAISSATGNSNNKPVGPLAILGHKSAFAIRNIQYKTYQTERIQLTGTSFRVYQGLHKNIDTLKILKPKRTGTTDTISHLVGDRKSQLVFDGTINIPHDGDYLFKLTAGGGAWFLVDGKLIADNKGSRDFERPFYARASFKKGTYPYQIVYSNSDECLVLHYEGPQIPWQSLTTPSSVRLSEKFEPLELEVKSKPVLQRGFMMHRGKVNPYTASVGIPASSPDAGNNYAYDMKKYNILSAWHGRFIDVSNMWRERGEKQMEIPLGAKLEFSGKPLIAKLDNAQSSWPDSVQAPDGVFASRGYKFNESGLPVYFFGLNQNSIEDLLYATKTNDGLTRELKVTTSNPEQTYVLLAEGNLIEKQPDGGYAVDNKNYYIENLEAGKSTAVIRQDGDVQQLIIPVSNAKETLTIKYNIIW